MRRLERLRLPLHVLPGTVNDQAGLVQSDDPRNPRNPPVFPRRQPGIARRLPDEIAPNMHPTPCQGHPAAKVAPQFLVGRKAVGDQDGARKRAAEQLGRRRGAARGIDMKPHRVERNPQPQPSARRGAHLAERLDPIAVGKRVAPLPPHRSVRAR